MSIYIIFNVIHSRQIGELSKNDYVHGLDTRNKNNIHLPTVSLSCIQKGVSYSGTKLFNKLPESIQNHRNDKKSFKNKLYGYLNTHSFYSITEFLEHTIDRNDT